MLLTREEELLIQLASSIRSLDSRGLGAPPIRRGEAGPMLSRCSERCFFSPCQHQLAELPIVVLSSPFYL